MEIKWGIIGCGDVTEIKSGPAFNKIADSKLVAVMRRDGDKAKDYALRHGVPKWYSDGYQLINDPDINAIYVATPPDSHEEYTVAALRAGKPVYVEKPMSTQVEDCIRMRDVANSTGSKLSVAHYRRALPMFIKIRELIDHHEIGEIRTVLLSMLQPTNSDMVSIPKPQLELAGSQRSVRAWRLDPAISGEGGLFSDLAPHQLDLMVHFFGPVAECYGLSSNQAGLYESRDIVSGIIRFRNNIIFNGIWCFTVAEALKEDRCEIIGSEGSISFSLFGNTVLVKKPHDSQELIFERPAHIQQAMIEKVVAYFSGKGPNPCSADNAIESMRLMEKFITP